MTMLQTCPEYVKILSQFNIPEDKHVVETKDPERFYRVLYNSYYVPPFKYTKMHLNQLDTLFEGLNAFIANEQESTYDWTNLKTKNYSTEEEAATLLEYLMTKDLITCDIETAHVSIVGNKLLAIGFAWGDAIAASITCFTQKVRNMLQRLLTSKKTKVIWHNGKFDTKMLKAIVNVNSKIDEDTMLLHYVGVNEKKGTHGLKILGGLYLQAPEWEEELNRFKKQWCREHKVKLADFTYDMIPTDILLPYLHRDVIATWRLFHLLKKLQRPQTQFIYRKLIEASNTFKDIELKGVKIDEEHINELDRKLQYKLDRVLRAIAKATEAKWNPQRYMAEMGAKSASEKFLVSSPKQLQWMLREFGFKLPSTDEEALSSCNSSDRKANQFVGFILRFRKLQKMHKTYVKGLKGQMTPAGRIHCSYNLHGTECVSGDTNIWTDEGLLRADTICGNNDGFTERVINVLAKEGVKSTSHVYVGKYRDTRKLQMGLGLSLRCTPEHPIYTDKGWILSKDLVPGDYILTSIGQNFFSQQDVVNPLLSELVGMYLADGHYRWNEAAGHYFISISNRDVRVRARIEYLVKELYGVDVYWDETNGSTKISGKDIVSQWKEWFPVNGAFEKHVPQFIRKGSRDAMIAFVRGCSNDSTWCVCSTGRNKPKKNLIRFNSVDKDRLEIIQQILLNLGIIASLTKVDYNSKNNVRRVGDTQADYQYQLNITGAQTQKYIKIIGTNSEQQTLTANKFLETEYLRSGFKNFKVIDGKSYVKVLSNELSDINEPVYDFTVPDVHNFTANCLIVHNTGRLSSSEPRHIGLVKRREFGENTILLSAIPSQDLIVI